MRMMLPVLAALAILSAPAHAQQNAFDLVGPAISLSVTRDAVTLPISQVPNLQKGDQLTARAALPSDKSARYLLVVAFLRGAATPPPKNWFSHVKTWDRRQKPLTVTVPEGAEQAIVMLAPEAGGGFDAVVDAVRERPGAFVRASQDLYQASLDRARLEAFVAGIARIEERNPDRLDAASPVLAKALALRLNAECLTRQRALRAACLTQNRENLVLQASSTSPTVSDRLIGAPTDVAYRIAATREGGAGYYSPYIGLARDLVRLFGAFRSTPYQYLPALAVDREGAMQLRLNTPPSFTTPRSVLVAALPPIGATAGPAWRVGGKGALCLNRQEIVVPIENAPLLYATGYARDLSFRLQVTGGRTVDLPVTVDAERGGMLIDDRAARDLVGPVAGAWLHGRWGFDRFDELVIPIQIATRSGWAPRPDAAVVVGRDHPLVLRGGASSCVEKLMLRSAGGEPVKVDWEATGPEEITATLPLSRTRPGPLTLTVDQAGTGPIAVDLVARSQLSRLESFTLHAGDAEATLTGERLDQVAEVQLGNVRFAPGKLARGDKGDQFALSSGDARVEMSPGTPGEASVRFRDGRTGTVLALVKPPRPGVALISRSVVAPPQVGAFAFTLPEGVMQSDAVLTFSFRMVEPLRAEDAVEIATQDGGAHVRLSVASGDLQRVGEDVGVVAIRPAKMLSASAVGELRFRLVRGSTASDWRPLAQVVRLPELDRLICPAEATGCSLTGNRLFLLAAIANTPDFARPLIVPAGFVGGVVDVPKPVNTRLYLRLRDAPTAVAQLAVAGQQ